MLPDSSAARYVAVSDTFTGLVEGAKDWSAAAPVAGWTAADVVWHLVDWIPDVLHDGAGLDLPRRNSSSPDPAADWARFDAALRTTVSGPLDTQFSHPMAGTMQLGAAFDMLVTPDLLMHSWDLARATNQKVELDPDYCTELFTGMSAVEEMLRASGHYGSRVEVPDDAHPMDRLMGFIGRDPRWTP